MRAVVFLGAGRWATQEVEDPRLELPDDVLLEVERTGICGTDLHILSDPPGHPATPGTILGHEYVGRVLECGNHVADLRPGDRVVVDPNITCGECEFCRVGRSNLCFRMTTLGIFRHGGLAKYNLAPARALHRISREIAPERAVLAEPLSCIYAAFEKAPPSPISGVVILGAGPIGLLFIQLYRRMGAGTIIAVEPREARRKVAAELGADRTLDFDPAALATEVRKVLPRGADIVIDAAGTLLVHALELVRPGGTAVLFGMVQNSPQAVSQYEITRNELTIIGSFIQRNAFPTITKLLEEKDFAVDKVVSHSLPLDRLDEGLESMRKGEALKVILRPAE